jgi:uncharacterized protein YwgA
MGSGEKRDMEKVANIIHDAGGRVVGRTRLQKIAFLLELTGLGEGLDFEYRHYGPYSEQLANAVSTATTVGLISEEERAASWGGSYSIFTTSNRHSNASSARLELIAKTASADPIALELAATAAYFAAEGESDPWGETARRKPEKAADRLDSAKSLYLRLENLSTPVSLPRISEQCFRAGDISHG